MEMQTLLPDIEQMETEINEYEEFTRTYEALNFYLTSNEVDKLMSAYFNQNMEQDDFYTVLCEAVNTAYERKNCVA